MRTIVERGIEGLREATADMVVATRAMLDVLLAALEGRSEATPEQIADMDVRINLYELELDHMCEVLLILKAPYAVDFRLIFTTIKVTRELERIGDEVKYAARWLPELGDEPPEALVKLARAAHENFVQATEALMTKDAAEARAVLARKEEFKAMEEALVGSSESTAVVVVAHAFGRIGARARNIAEDAIYIVSANDVRHPRSRASRA